MDSRFGLFILDSNMTIPEDFGYDFVFENSIDSYRASTKDSLLESLIDGLNDETISDTNWFFICDIENGIILSRVPFEV